MMSRGRLWERLGSKLFRLFRLRRMTLQSLRGALGRYPLRFVTLTVNLGVPLRVGKLASCGEGRFCGAATETVIARMVCLLRGRLQERVGRKHLRLFRLWRMTQLNLLGKHCRYLLHLGAMTTSGRVPQRLGKLANPCRPRFHAATTETKTPRMIGLRLFRLRRMALGERRRCLLRLGVPTTNRCGKGRFRGLVMETQRAGGRRLPVHLGSLRLRPFRLRRMTVASLVGDRPRYLMRLRAIRLRPATPFLRENMKMHGADIIMELQMRRVSMSPQYGLMGKGCRKNVSPQAR